MVHQEFKADGDSWTAKRAHPFTDIGEDCGGCNQTFGRKFLPFFAILELQPPSRTEWCTKVVISGCTQSSQRQGFASCSAPQTRRVCGAELDAKPWRCEDGCTPSKNSKSAYDRLCHPLFPYSTINGKTKSANAPQRAWCYYDLDLWPQNMSLFFILHLRTK